jgi:hypothetical protein
MVRRTIQEKEPARRLGEDMIAWAGLLGKIIEFVAIKLVGARIDLSLSDKKKAGSLFMGLYVSISQLEALVSEIVSELKEVTEIEGATLRSSWLSRTPDAIQEVSEKFLKSFGELHSIVSIYDAELGQAISALAYSKFLFISRVRLLANDKGFGYGLAFESPADELVKFVQRDWREKDIAVAIGDMTRHWENLIITDKVLVNDKEKIKGLYAILKNHLSILSAARARLRELMATKFSIEDLLHVRNLDK